MLRSEFLELNTFCDLENVTSDMGYEYILENLYTQDDFEDRIKDEISDNLQYDNIWQIALYINNLPESGFDRYEYVDGDWYGVNDGGFTFEDYKQQILDAYDYDDLWEDSEEYEEPEPEPEPDLELEPVSEPFDIMEVMQEAETVYADTMSRAPVVFTELEKSIEETCSNVVSEEEEEACSDDDINTLMEGML